MAEKEMSFLDHLEELRWHLVRGLVAVIVVAIWAFTQRELIFDTILLGPSRPGFYTYKALCALGMKLNWDGFCIEKLSFVIQNRTMTGQFTTHLWISFLTGLIIAFPYVFWEIWRFIRPALYETEMSVTRGAVLFVSFLFLTGIAFGYFILSPLSINFLANYQISEQIENFIDLASYISTLTTMVLACGLMFQLPAVVMVLTRIGIVGPAKMRKFRKHSFIVILIVAGFLTPSPDVFSQLLMGLPLYMLFEFSIFLSAFVERKRLASEAAGLSPNPA